VTTREPPERPARRRVLVASPFPPRLDGRHGGSRSIAQLLAGLAARHDVALVALRRRDEPGVDPVLGQACDLVEEVQIPPVGGTLVGRAARRLSLRLALLRGLPTWAAERRAPQFDERLHELVQRWRPELVQLEYRIMAQFLPAIPRSVPTLVVEHDPVQSDAGVSPILAPLERRAWRRLGRLAARCASAVVVFTERDQAALEAESTPVRVALIPLGYELPEPPLDPLGGRGDEIVCVGSFVHPPNVEAARWLALDIFPSVRRRRPKATLRLVGSQPPAEVLALRGEAVAVEADVDLVSPYLDAAAVVAAPVRSGGGMRVKVLEALAAGKALVATPLAVEGVRIQDGKEALIAETEADFAAALVELLEHPERRVAIARSAREWAERNLDLSRQVSAYEALYDDVVASSCDS
jgi:glycosyltransferase involved in cell wall biosynthesis